MPAADMPPHWLWAAMVANCGRAVARRSTITLAYSWQVSGKAMEQPDQRLDLLTFERQQFRVRWVPEF
jgi:hypothetical protein